MYVPTTHRRYRSEPIPLSVGSPAWAARTSPAPRHIAATPIQAKPTPTDAGYREPVRFDDVDALVVMSFGGPESMAEVMPFLRHVVAGRDVPDERLAAVAEQYHAFNGVSPLNGHNRDLVSRLREQAPRQWRGQKVYLANRNSHPFPQDSFAMMAEAGVQTVAAFITSAFSSYSGCRQYRQNLTVGADYAGIDVKVLPRFYDHPILRDIWVDRVVAAQPGPGTRVVFVTHSLPVAQARGVVPGITGYLAQHEALAAEIAERAGDRMAQPLDWTLAFQSRSGPPHQPWLEPDISPTIESAADDGVSRVVVAPIGFCADNLEIRWDLDTVAAATAADRGIEMQRLDPPQSEGRFTDLVWDLFAVGDGFSCQVGCCPDPHGGGPAVGER